MKTCLQIVFITALIVNYGCNEVDHKHPSNNADSSKTTGSAYIHKNSEEEYRNRIPQKQLVVSNIDSFLLKPFDLYKFKQIKGGSNSGGGDKRPYFFKPNYKGIYYSFFYFMPMTGYIGNNIIKTENGLHITTFKPLGKYKNDYLDPNEELIEVIARYNDFDLPELAFIGLDTIQLRRLLGKESFSEGNCFFYVFKDRALILPLKNGNVHRLKYLHLKKRLTAGNVPDGLLQ